jgi:hypothetical protein
MEYHDAELFRHALRAVRTDSDHPLRFARAVTSNEAAATGYAKSAISRRLNMPPPLPWLRQI